VNDEYPNALEAALAKAAMEPAVRPEFYRLLLESEVYVLGRTEKGASGSRNIDAGEHVEITSWRKTDGASITPFFASLDALRLAIQEEQSYMRLPARSLFEITQGVTLVLNPASKHVKEFFPNEVEALLSTGMNHTPQARVVKKATTVLLGQPADYPSQMVDALTTLLAKHSSVKAAYLCMMHDPSFQDLPGLVVGLEGDGGIERAIQEAGSVAVDTAPKGKTVDFVRIARGSEGLSAYFLESVKPFYERSWGAKLKMFFGYGRA
jgi:hypothetical protein